mgnify:CR=1 FL=1
MLATAPWVALERLAPRLGGIFGLPGWGAKSAAAVLAVYGHLEGIPPKAAAWEVPSLRGAATLALTLREQWEAALRFRDLARLRTAADGVVIPQRAAEELRWHGASRAGWEAFCATWGLGRLRDRPHRWREDG